MKHWLNEGLEMLRVLHKAKKQSREVSKQKSKKQNKKTTSQVWVYINLG